MIPCTISRAEHDATRCSKLDEERGCVVDVERLEPQNVLAGELKWHATCDEHVEVRSAVEQVGDVHRSGSEMLEIVEEQEGTRSVQGIRDALDQRSAGHLSNADGACDRLRHEIWMRRWCEPDEVHRAVERRASGSWVDPPRGSAPRCSPSRH